MRGVRAVYWVVVLAAAALCGLFAVSNLETVSLGLWPLPFLVDAPLYLVVAGALIVGFVVGAVAAWLGGRRRRSELRHCRRRVEALGRELAATQSQFAAEAHTSGPELPPGR